MGHISRDCSPYDRSAVLNWMSISPGATVTAATIRAMVCQKAFGRSLIANNMRGLVAEALVASVLESEWRWCSDDWYGWDFDRADGLKLEVKQSAALQTWKLQDGRASACRYDIKARQGRYDGADWYPGKGRNADLFVMAHHFVADDTADHRAPEQWRFFVIAERALPLADSIGLRRLEKLIDACDYDGLAAAVAKCASELQPSIR